MTARERPEHDTHWQQTQVGRATVPRGHCPPAASADRVLFPLCGAIKQQASKGGGSINFQQKNLVASSSPDPAADYIEGAADSQVSP